MKTFSELRKDDILSKEQMGFFKGGALGTCKAFLPGGSPYELDSAESVMIREDRSMVFNGISKETALSLTQGIPGARWCCDSCNEASWA